MCAFLVQWVVADTEYWCYGIAEKRSHGHGSTHHGVLNPDGLPSRVAGYGLGQQRITCDQFVRQG